MPGWWTLINCVCSVDLEKVCWKHFSEWGEVEVKTSGGFYLRWDTCGGPQCIHATLTFALSSAPDSDSPTHSHAHSNGTHSCVLPGYVVFTRPFGVGFRDATYHNFALFAAHQRRVSLVHRVRALPTASVRRVRQACHAKPG